MPATLTVTSKAVAFGDSTGSNNPLRRHFDWTRTYSGIAVNNPKTQQESIDPGATKVFFNGSRTLTTDGTSAFTVSLSALDPSRYRFTFSGGTNPGLRTDRALTLTSQTVTVTANLNASATFQLGAGSFSALQVGDTVYIPSVTTGDAQGPFNEMNAGFWQVLAVTSSTVLQLVRPTGSLFSAVSEVVTLTSNAQLQGFASVGVQAGDKVAITAGFSTPSRRIFTVAAATSTWFEVFSNSALPVETATPGAAGLTFFTAAKRFLRIETDQDVVVQFNGDTTQNNRLTPDSAGDPEQVAWLEKGYGPVYSLSVVNLSPVSANVLAVSAE